MKRVVYKYPIDHYTNTDVVRLEIPKGAQLLAVHYQRTGIYAAGITTGTGMLWAVVDPDERATEVRTFKMVITGKEFDQTGLQYIGTYQLYEGSIIIHLFEVLF